MFTEKRSFMSSQVFISYSHDNDEHKSWVMQVATRLRHNGVDVILDQWNLKLGQDLSMKYKQKLRLLEYFKSLQNKIYY